MNEPPEYRLTERLLEVYRGTRTIMGSDHSVTNTVEPNGRRWLVAFGVCNGTPSGSHLYHTKQAALEAAGLWDEQVGRLMRVRIG